MIFSAGRFSASLETNLVSLHQILPQFYQTTDAAEYVDFHISLNSVPGLRRFIKPLVNFAFCHQAPFTPLPKAHAFPLLEWGLNWCVSQKYFDALVFHAAVVEKEGKAIILPGEPGSGKSTLCAAMVVQGGWRLLSDELTIVHLQSGDLLPNPRPISLKNQSIDIVKSLPGNNLLFSASAYDTVKGTVALMKPPVSAFEKIGENARPLAVIFPQYDPTASLSLTPLVKANAAIQLAEQSFNYSVLGHEGFQSLARLIDNTDVYEFRYSGDINAALDVFDSLL